MTWRYVTERETSLGEQLLDDGNDKNVVGKKPIVIPSLGELHFSRQEYHTLYLWLLRFDNQHEA
jgi:hypothetical protein